MKLSQETELNKHLKEQPASGFYLLWGAEDYLIQRWKEKIIQPFIKDSFNFAKLDGQILDLNDMYDATQQLPVFSPQRCVLVDDLDPKKLVAAEMKKLEQVVVELPEETILLLTARHLDGKSAIGKKVIALADQFGVAAELAPRDTAGLVRYLQSVAKKTGCFMEPATAKEMIRLCGNNMQKLTTEMGKVCAYAGKGEITSIHLEAVVTAITEEKVFDLSKAIFAGNRQRAMEIVGNLIYLRESPIAIVATLVMSYTDLFRARTARDQGKNTADVTSLFAYKGREFRVRNAFNSSMTTPEIRTSLGVLYQCDWKMKSTGLDTALLLEEAVLSLLYIGKG